MEPQEREVKNFYFRQLRKVNVGDAAVGGASQGRCSLVCNANSFGITFVGCKSGVYAFKTSVLHTVDLDEDIGPQNVMADISCLRAIHIPTPSPPLDVGLSCDELTLSVCLRDGNYLKCCFFDTRILTKRGSPLAPFTSIAMTTQPDVYLCGLAWSPASPELLAMALSNRTLALLEVKKDVSIVARKEAQANTVCWSPKGKQLAVGLRDGTVVQLKPTSQGFEVKKSIPCPDVFNGEPQQVTDLHWLSSFLFAVVYTPQAPANSAPSFVFLSVPKNEAPLLLNFDDVFYGTGTKQSKFYFSFISKWNILISSSANAIESVVFSQRQVDGGGAAVHPWEKWELEDTGRAEAPLDEANDETFPAGMALSYSSEEEIKLNEATTLPPCPLLLMYTDHGVLCPFSVVNTGCSPDDIRALSIPPQPLPGDPAREPAPQIPSSEPQRSSPLQRQQAIRSGLPAGDSMPFTPVSKPAVTAKAGMPANPLGNPKTGMAAAGTGGGGPFSGLSFGGGKLGSSSGQPSSFQFSVSSITGGQPPTGMPSAVSTAQAATHPLATSASAPLCRPGIQTSLPLQQPGLAQPMTAGQPPLYPHSMPPQPGPAAELQPAALAQPAAGRVPTSQPPPNVVVTSLGQLPAHLAAAAAATTVPAVHLAPALTLNQSIQLGQLGQPPLQSSTPLTSAGPLLTGGRPLGGVPRPPPAYPSQASPAPPTTQTLAYQTPPPSYQSPAPPTARTLAYQAPPPSFQMSPATPTAQTQMPPPRMVPNAPIQLAATHPQLPMAPPGQPSAPRPQLPMAPPGQPSTSRPPLPMHMTGQPAPPHPPPPVTIPTAPIQKTQLAATRPQLPMAPPGQPSASRPPLPMAPPGQPSASRPQLPMAPPGQPSASRPPLPMAPPGQPSAPRPPLPMHMTGQPAPLYPQPPPTGGPPTYPGAQEDNESVISENPDNIEALFSAHIQDEIDRFTDELEALKENLRDVFGEGWEAEGGGGGGGEGVRVEGLGSVGDMQQLREDTLETEGGIREVSGRAKDLDRRCGRMGDDGLRGFELAEEARANLKKKSDPNYAALLKLRPLDAYNARRLEEVRRSFLQVEQNVSEVNSQLSADLERRYEERRQNAGGRSPLKAPSVQTIYSTLRSHRQISRMQGASIEQVANKMKRLRLIPQSWHLSAPLLLATPPPTPVQEATPPRDVLQPSFQESESEAGEAVDHKRVEKLRDHLSNIVHIPMQRVKPNPAAGFIFTSEQSGTASPLQSSQLSGTETPQSMLPEDPISALESDAASATDYRPHHGALPRLPPALLGSSRAPFHGAIGNGGGADQPGVAIHLQQAHHQGIMPSSLLAAQQTEQSITSSLGSSLRSQTYSLPPGPDVIATSVGRIKVSTAEGYKTPPTQTIASVPQVTHQSRKPGIILTSDQQFLVRAGEGYDMATLSSGVPDPQPVPLQGSRGTVHWGSPPKSEPSRSQQQGTGYRLEGTSAILPGLSARLDATESPGSTGVPNKQPASSLPPQGISTGSATPTLFDAQGIPSSGSGGMAVPTGGPSVAAAIPASHQESSPSTATQSHILPVGIGSIVELRRTEPVSDLTKVHPAKGSTMSNLAPVATTAAPPPGMALPKSEIPQSILSLLNSGVSVTQSISLGSGPTSLPSLTSVAFTASSTAPIFSLGGVSLSPDPGLASKPANTHPQYSSDQKVASQANTFFTSSETKGAAGMTTPITSTTFSAPSGSGAHTLFASLPKLTPSFSIGSGGSTPFQSLSIGSGGSTPFQFGVPSLSGSSSVPSVKTSGPSSDSQPALSTGATKPTSAPSFALGSILSPPSSGSTVGKGVPTTGIGASSIFGSFLTSGASSSFPSSLGSMPFKLTQFGAEKSTSVEGTEEREEETLNDGKTSSAPKDDVTTEAPTEGFLNLQNLTSTGAFEAAVQSEVDASKSILGIDKPGGAGAAGIAGGRPASSLLQRLTAEDTGEPAGKQGGETESGHKFKPPEATASIAPSEDDKVEPSDERDQVSPPVVEDQGVTLGMVKTGNEKLVESSSAASGLISSLATSVAPGLPPVSLTKEPTSLPAAAIDTSSVVAATAPPHTSTSPSETGDSMPPVTATVVLQVSEAATTQTPFALPTTTAATTTTTTSSSSSKEPTAPGPIPPPTSGTTSEGGVARSHGPAPPLLHVGSEDSTLQSAEPPGVEDLDMDGMENDMEPIDASSEQQPVAGGSMMGSLSLGLGGRAGNSSANPFGTPLQPTNGAMSSTSGPFQTKSSGGGGSGFLKPATGTFGGGISAMGGVQLQQQTSPAGAGMGLGMAASGQQPLFGSTPAFGAASSIGGSPFGRAPLFSTGFGSPPNPNPTEMIGRIFGVQTGPSEQSAGGGISFGSLAQQQSASGGFESGGFGSGGGSGSGQSLTGLAPSSSMTGAQFSSWRS